MATAATNPQARYERPWLASYQLESIFCPERYSIIEASTKSGKTVGCLVWLFEQAAVSGQGRSFWWVAPVYPQAEIAYRRMKRGLPREYFKSNDTERRLELANGALLWFKSGEKPDNLYGDDVFGAVVDEASRLREESWYALRSTLTATRGPVRLIGNVKGRTNWFYRLARRAQRGERGMRYTKITAADAVRAGILKQAEIDDARQNLPPSVYRELFEAEAADLEGRVYPYFAPENINDEVYDLGGTLYVGMDFNVNPMTAVICALAGDELHVFDEIYLPNSNTHEMRDELLARYPNRQVFIYPDPSGKQRKSSAHFGETDFSILRSAGFSVIAKDGSIPVVDRINEVNALCLNAAGRRRLQVNPRCANLIESLEGQVYTEGTSQPDKRGGLDHMADALGYLVHDLFPLAAPTNHVAVASSYAVIGA